MANPQREVLFESFDEGWGKNLATSLLTYSDGGMDLHRQTGPGFRAALDRAKGILESRGLKVGAVELVGPTGAYVRVLN